MANYELPQVRVFQDLEPSIEPSERQMLPVIIGQRRDIFDYDVLAETGKLGDYVMTNDLLADWDGLGANSTVIQNTVRIYGEDLKVSLVKAGFVEELECLSPLHEDFDATKYFSPIVDNQENALIFATISDGVPEGEEIGDVIPSINLSGSSLYRTPEVGDFIKVRQTSQDTVDQDEDWTAEVIGLIETETARVNFGVGTPKEGAANTFDTAAEPHGETASTTTEVGGDIRLGVDYYLVPLQDIGTNNAAYPWLAKYQEIGLNKACEEGIFNLNDLGYKIRVSNVTDAALDLTIQSKARNEVISDIAIDQFIKCATSTVDLWFNQEGVTTDTPNDAFDSIGGVVVDEMFILYGIPKADTTSSAVTRTNGVVNLTVASSAGMETGDYATVTGLTADFLALNGRFKITVVDSTHITYELEGSDLDGGETGSQIANVCLSPVKNDSFELTGSLERPAQHYSGAGTGVPALTAAANFDATVDTVYTIEVIEGGAQDCSAHGVDDHYPNINLRISSNNALDPTEICSPVVNWNPETLAGDGTAADVRIGLKGVEVTFNPTPKDISTTAIAGTLTATRASGVATLTSTVAHGLSVGEFVTVVCTGDTSLSTTRAKITDVPTTTTLKYVNAGEDVPSAQECSSADSVVFFNLLAFSKGDIWTIDCTGRSGDEVVGVITDKNFENFRSDLETQRLDVEFMEKLDGTTEIPRLQADSIENWEINPDDVEGVEYDLRFISGAQVRVDDIDADLTISDGQIFMTYEAVNNSDTGSIVMVLDASDKDDELGPDDPRNPLGYGVRKALLNSRGVPVLAVPVDEMEEEDVDDALSLLSLSNNAYQITPMTFDESIQNKVVAHVLSMSTETMDLWRRAYISTPIGHEYGIVTVDANNDQVTGTFEANGTSFNKLVLDPSAVGVSFLQSKVKAGHVVRFNYGVDMYGDTTYSEFTVLSVLNATELLVLGDYGSASATMDICVYKDTSADDIIYEVGNRSEGLNSRRVTNVFPSILVDDNDQAVPGYFAAAALAGLAAGSEPHQGHTNSKILGFSEASTLAPMRRMDIFSMNELAGKGVTIIIGEASDIGIRHELTTAMIDRKNRETMVTRNLDSLSYMYFDALSPFIGIANVTPEFVNKIRTELTSIGNYIISTTKRPLIGSQMTSCIINSVEQDLVLADKINVYISPVLPLPFNYGDIHLQI